MCAQFVSRTNRVTVPTTDEAQFVWAGLRRYLGQCARGLIRPQWRTPDTVRSEYDGERTPLADRAAALSWDELVYGDPAVSDFILVDDRVIWTTYAEPRAQSLQWLEALVQSLPTEQATVVEFGSGTGRNLLYLKRAFPHLRCIGLELSPVSARLARALAARFQLDVTFYICDVTAQVPVEPQSAHLVFSCHALEQMPRLFPKAVARMCETSMYAVGMLEPVPDLWRWNIRGIASRLRVHALDRLRNVMPVLRQVEATGKWNIVMAQRLHTASNPLNETCQILLLARKPTVGEISGVRHS